MDTKLYQFSCKTKNKDICTFVSGNEFIKHNMYIKDCVGKTQPDSDRYIRIASRTEEENCNMATALVDVIGLKN